MLSGRSNQFIRHSDEGAEIRRFNFCPACGATVFYTNGDSEDLIAIPVGAFVDPAFPPPQVSVWEQRKHGWVVVPDGAEHMLVELAKADARANTIAGLDRRIHERRAIRECGARAARWRGTGPQLRNLRTARLCDARRPPLRRPDISGSSRSEHAGSGGHTRALSQYSRQCTILRSSSSSIQIT
jgi:hypothetical protein